MQFRPLTSADAHAITRWRYRGHFARYNLSPADTQALLRLDYRYHVGVDADRADRIEGILGFYCAGPDARVPGGRYRDGEPAVIDFGVGLHPDRLGQGLGRSFTLAALAHAAATLQPDRLRVTIANTNRRSLSLFKSLGFDRTHTFRREDNERFVILEQQSAALPTSSRC